MRVDAPAARTASVPTSRRFPDWLAVVVAAAVAVLVVGLLAREPERVESISITNPTAYQLTVDVVRPGSDSELRLGTVPRDQTVSFRQVIDHGEQWLVRLSYAGQDGGEVEVDRASLEAGWTVPDEIDEALRAAGLEQSSETTPGLAAEGETQVEGTGTEGDAGTGDGGQPPG
jgi:hypothetical protein